MGIGEGSTNWPDYVGEWGRYAAEQIYDTYGHTVRPKWKTLRKFGRKVLPAKDTRYTVMQQASTAVASEAHTTANTIDTVICSTTNTNTLSVEGHTIDTSGDLTFVVQSVTLNSSNPVSLGTPLARCTRMAIGDGSFATPAVNNTANIYAYQSTKTGVSGGVPSSAAHVNCMISSGYNQSEKAATSVSAKDYWLITGVQASLPQGASPTGTAAVDINLEIKSVKGGVFKPVGAQMAVGSGFRYADEKYYPYIIVPPNSDVRLSAIGSTSDLEVTGTIAGFLLGVSTGDAS